MTYRTKHRITSYLGRMVMLGMGVMVGWGDAWAQEAEAPQVGDDAPTKGIAIAGSIFGGGQNGDVNKAKESAEVKGDAASVYVSTGSVGVNIYGGGDKGESFGNTSVTLAGGTITANVFGGAKEANVYGTATTTIDAANQENDLKVGKIFGGNDVAGTISGKVTVASTTPKTGDAEKSIYVGDLFAGGNGDYDYTSADYSDKSAPDLANAELDLKSGCYGRVFGGGNKATITASTNIKLNNTSQVLKDASGNALTHQFGSVFGGNNLVAMSIRPTWNLTAGSIENLYSGGNKGDMTYANGLIMELKNAGMTVGNVFGGCRIANVTPSSALEETIDGFTFPAGYGTRVRVTAGKITNVYGGNDISGDIKYGTNVIIQNDIIGDVYGGGNGSYAYTDQDASSDYYFTHAGVTDGVGIMTALNNHRPNSHNVLIQIEGTEANKTYIGGSVFCGGNSATLRTTDGALSSAYAELRLGSYVVANQVFLGSNGANMVTEDVMRQVTANTSDVVDLKNSAIMEEYMKGVEVAIRPKVSIMSGFVPQSTYIGSFYCGGNVGSMTAQDMFDIGFLNSIVIFDKLVAGCNNANVPYRNGVNAFHQGGLTTHNDTKVKLDVAGLKMEPKKLVYDSANDQFNFTWNTYTEEDYKDFLKGGNIYGGCYQSGIVNGDVQINVTKDIITSDTYTYFTEHESAGQGWDSHCFEPMVSALCVFGGGYGDDTEIWGNATINITDGARVLKVRGGGEKGWIGKMARTTNGELIADTPFSTYTDKNVATTHPRKKFTTAYNTTINLNAQPIKANGDVITGTDMTGIVNNVGEICAGGQEGVVTGNCTLNIDGGSTFCAFAGASNSDIYGATETFIGKKGYPYVTETVYGGNDFGGQIMGTLVHETGNKADGSIKSVRSNTYVEYIQGEIGYQTGKSVKATGDPSEDYGIFAGAFGKYDYNDKMYKVGFVESGASLAVSKPVLMSHVEVSDDEKAAGMYGANTFLNLSSTSTSAKDKVHRAYGGSEGQAGWEGVATTYSTYVLLNAKNSADRTGTNYLAEQVFGGGDCSKTYYTRVDAYGFHANSVFAGCRGMSNERKTDVNGHNISYMSEKSELNVYPSLATPQMDLFGAGAYSGSKETAVNLLGGTIHDVYGSSLNQGVTYVAKVDVPTTSTLKANAIYGGGKGESVKDACDTYVSFIGYHTEQSGAYVNEAIYGGNNQYRFTFNSYLDIDVPVHTSTIGTFSDIFGAGHGANTIHRLAKVDLKEGAVAKYVYGGGRDGKVYNVPSLKKYITDNDYFHTTTGTGIPTSYWAAKEPSEFASWFTSWKSTQAEPAKSIVIPAFNATSDTENSTQILLAQGVAVSADVYGGGLGSGATVAGKTDVQLNGAIVAGNLYGGGRGGNVADEMGVCGDNLVSTNVTLFGGSVLNAFGGGYQGSVGTMTETKDGSGKVTARTFTYGNSNMTVGSNAYTAVAKDAASGGGFELVNNAGFYNGDPTIARSLYGGGEKGAVHGNATLTFNNGHVGYIYNTTTNKYEDNVDLIEAKDSLLYQNGNVFGGGYGEGATTLNSNVVMKDGVIRNGLYGGGEIASVGIGKTKEEGDEFKKERKLDTSFPVTHGHSQVTMYRGHVIGDVFGGGRGFSYDIETGNEVTGEIFYTDGYVFGTTGVVLYGGEVGTSENVQKEHGNVFGGGNVGYVYTDLGTKQADDVVSGGVKTKTAGYYYNSAGNLTEDTKVVISPYAMVLNDGGTNIGGKEYSQFTFVPTSEMDKLTKNASAWDDIDYQYGVTVHNAVFAGGNVSRGSDKLFANTTTVYGNSTASLVDVYNRDLISVGTEHTGGLYGDGNLTLVDGYRELSITNYGTDYYSLQTSISLERYNQLNDRERAYFELRYRCISAYDNHQVGDDITEEDWRKLPSDKQAKWEKAGFCSIYAGRLLNTMQRADFIGVFGSRIVLQGAVDRVIDQVDYTEYAINRVGEVSLNKRASTAANEDANNTTHGNYFGMYNIVNYLEALTSDVNFYDDKRTTSNTKYDDDGILENRTYYEYKEHHKEGKYRNNGTSLNKVALAKGVYLEIVKAPTSSESTDKEYGPITGVVELDLMDTQQDLGGAYVYAKNYHGTRSGSMLTQAILSQYNTGARTHKGYTYGDDNIGMQSSGNFVNPLKQIYDDCYPNNGDATSPAHYWFLRGTIYTYDQTISAYTGSSTAYKADVQIPLTISSGSNGKLKVVSVQPNLYAYYKEYNADTQVGTKLGANEEKVIGTTTYKLNDLISYWDWTQLSESQKNLFVRDTYIATADFKLTENDSKTYSKKDVLLPADLMVGEKLRDSLWSMVKNDMVPSKDVVRRSNSLSHKSGYALTADITNPNQWNDRYIEVTDATPGTKVIHSNPEYQAIVKDLEDKVKAGTMTEEAMKLELAKYIEGPSYWTDKAGVYGQKSYGLETIIANDIHSYYEQNIYNKIKDDEAMMAKQATMERAYISKKEVSYTVGGKTKNLQEGVSVPKSEYEAMDATAKAAFDEAWVCTSTIENTFMSGDVVSKTVYDNYKTKHPSDADAFKEAYICSKAGLYSGNYFEANKNYNTLTGWCSLSPEDRTHFKFNYDAFDLFINDLDPNAQMYEYDKLISGNTRDIYYSDKLDIEYEATLKSGLKADGKHLVNDGGKVVLQYSDKDGTTQTVDNNAITRKRFEEIPNEKSYYIPVTIYKVEAGESQMVDRYFIVKEFTRGDHVYLPGNETDKVTYDAMTSEEKANVRKLTFTASTTENKEYYLCNKTYKVNEKGEGKTVSALNNESGVVGSAAASSIVSGSDVPVGTVISKSNYTELINLQYLFDISGRSPIETSTLYVSRDADIFDAQTDRIVTLIYQYQYDESSNDGTEVEQVTERHVVNIRIAFLTGAPKIGELRKPGVIYPGRVIGLRQPTVAEGAYEIMGGGWEIFENEEDALNHVNGKDYVNSQTPMYFYQDGYYAAYYTKTYLGKTYSNPVRLTVANYHRMEDVMTNTHTDYEEDGVTVKAENVKDYMFLNKAIEMKSLYPDRKIPRIYIDGHECKDNTKSELDYLKEFFDAGVAAAADDPYLNKLKNCENLVFYMQDDAAPKKYKDSWTSIGTSANHFKADLHGDGHFISGLNNSLFGYFDGNVWNLGVKGSFTGAGIADHAASSQKATNCWVWTTADMSTSPVMNGGTLVNCYYLANNKSNATKTQFLNGELAYKLNDYYLHKRFQDSKETSTSNTYQYWKADNSGNLRLTTGSYSSADADKYVEQRYEDTDFLYANGVNTSTDNVRNSTSHYYPVYPDDYIFFGQRLSYGVLTGEGFTQDENPVAVRKNTDTDELLVGDEDKPNRVFRAPAYFGSKEAGTLFFNKDAAFKNKYLLTGETEPLTIHDGLTAVDFTGYNDASYTDKSGGYKPVLDYDGINTINTDGITANLLVYADARTDASYDKIAAALVEPELTGDEKYKYIDKVISMPKGHLVDLTGIGYVATRNHFLVDGEDFNCPISYKFSNDGASTPTDTYMWYQRTPSVYADGTKGWETICLPFTADLVTTHQKGALSHFYNGNADDDHEYWLRGYRDTQVKEEKTIANFYDPYSTKTEKGYDSRYRVESTYPVENTFLWDYYYNAGEHKDNNKDYYQVSYSKERIYQNYPNYTGSVPYIIAFPGETFFEFDLSGKFQPANTNATIDKLDPQVITFASVANQTIAVTDDEPNYTALDGKELKYVGSYTKKALGANDFAIDPTGAAFKKVGTDAVNVMPFRAYFTTTSSGVKEIMIGGETDAIEENLLNDQLIITSENRRIFVESRLSANVTLQVVNAAGMVVDVMTLEPGDKKATGVLSTGVYIVGRTKILVK